MRTKLISLSIALLLGVSVWAEDVWNYNVYEDCSKNGYKGGYAPAPADVQAVDLGLPSGLKWASCNIGTTTPEDYGDYFAWGEVLPKDNYSWETYKYANGTMTSLTKYCSDASFGNNNFTDNKTTLESEDDAATANCGKEWRMPTDAEWTELRKQCTWTWTTQNGVNGYLVASKTNSNSIFLPAAGYCPYIGLPGVGSKGYYWSSSLVDYNPSRAWFVYFTSDYVSRFSNDRNNGFSVRSVQDTQTGTGFNYTPTTETTAVQKIICNGQVLILRGDKTYTAVGMEVR